MIGMLHKIPPLSVIYKCKIYIENLSLSLWRWYILSYVHDGITWDRIGPSGIGRSLGTLLDSDLDLGLDFLFSIARSHILCFDPKMDLFGIKLSNFWISIQIPFFLNGIQLFHLLSPKRKNIYVSPLHGTTYIYLRRERCTIKTVK